MSRNDFPFPPSGLRFTLDESTEKTDLEEEWELCRKHGTAWRRKQFRLDMEGVEEEFKKGNKGALLEAVFLCALYSLPLPKWCAEGFCKAYDKILNYETSSWEDLFGKPYAKGTKIEAQKGRLDKMRWVYLRVREIKAMNPEIPIDEGFFKRVGDEIGISGGLANRFYYMIKRFSEPGPKS